MRGLAYAVAAIAAVGIMIAIGTGPTSEPTAPASSASATTADVSLASTDSPGTLTISVPEMHCAVSCFPRVKAALENTAAVKSVELGPQKEEGLIDNRQVIVSYDAGFSPKGALDLLQEEGFTDSTVIQ
ncbi:hypothetical protein K227x_60750 [Rubripirellula lacrimiformis]|uniref:HMA domain-containing protein n=1 Tax=Rubripirellula lacrimiformis TaxID=1930273 RepID=A0A517NKH6_9BACT|nr:heavy-metal-associated domain-containing protein [Rubripirellula lacrimiformis]QDT07647.1 hypothetical protein K227x_60750 [Rubripirellula lacrimiformis]